MLWQDSLPRTTLMQGMLQLLCRIGHLLVLLSSSISPTPQTHRLGLLCQSLGILCPSAALSCRKPTQTSLVVMKQDL